jgi:hypothetical protein
MAGSSGGKTGDEIVDELAQNILGKLPEKLDIDRALPEMFQVIIVVRECKSGACLQCSKLKEIQT